jgi:hypothetical protein
MYNQYNYSILEGDKMSDYDALSKVLDEIGDEFASAHMSKSQKFDLMVLIVNAMFLYLELPESIKTRVKRVQNYFYRFSQQGCNKAGGVNLFTDKIKIDRDKGE